MGVGGGWLVGGGGGCPKAPVPQMRSSKKYVLFVLGWYYCPTFSLVGTT